MALKLGKNRVKEDKRTLRLEEFIAPTLAAPPASAEYYNKVSGYPMYLNDQYGDCTIAAQGHAIQTWTAAAFTEVDPSDADILHTYEHFVGTPPPPDAGCYMLDVLNYWRRTGMISHRIEMFAGVDPKNLIHAKLAIYLLGGLYIGLALPDFAVQGDMLNTPWITTGKPESANPPNPDNGHCVHLVGYDNHYFYAVTWGEVKLMGHSFFKRYCDEAYAIVSRDFITASGLDVAGIDLPAMEQAVKKL